MKSEWQPPPVSSSIQIILADFNSLDCLDSYPDLSFPQSLFLAFGNRFNHVPQLFNFLNKYFDLANLFASFHFKVYWRSKIH